MSVNGITSGSEAYSAYAAASAKSATASTKNMGCLLLFQLLKPDVPIKTTWNTRKARAGRQN